MSEWNSIEELIVHGKHALAKKAIQSIALSEVPRGDLVILSDFSRRVGDSLYSLKILGKVMKDHLNGLTAASDDELLSYSRALIKLGFFQESEKWLDNLSKKSQVEALEIRGRMHVTQWNYPKACFFYENYLKKIPQDSYKHVVGSLNLSASYLGAEKFERAIVVLEKLIEYSIKNKKSIILANSYELMAQAQLALGKYKDAREFLHKSRKALNSSGNVYEFYVKKWMWVIEISENGPTPEVLESAEKLKYEAANLHSWEDIRTVDKNIALHTEDIELATKLYFGTSHEWYRQQIRNELLQNVDLPETYLWSFGDRKKALENVIQVKSLNKVQGVLRSVFDCLTRDFYRPISMGYLFSHTYEGEIFDPHSSPSRIYQSVHRLRSLLPEELDLVWGSEGVYFEAQKPIALSFKPNRKFKDRAQRDLEAMRDRFKRSWFSSKQVANLFNVSQRSAQRLIKEAGERYRINDEGKGPAKRYRFVG